MNAQTEPHTTIELYSAIAKFKPSVPTDSAEYVNKTLDGYYVLKVKYGHSNCGQYQFFDINEAKNLIDFYKEKISEYKVIKQVSEITEYEVESGFL